MSDLSELAGEWHALNARVRAATTAAADDPAAPAARLLDARAHLWQRIADALDADTGLGPDVAGVLSAACHYAALLDQADAAEARYAAGVPVLFPGMEAELLRLHRRRCAVCDRPWQLGSADACAACPRLRFGVPGGPAHDVDPADLLRGLGVLDD